MRRFGKSLGKAIAARPLAVVSETFSGAACFESHLSVTRFEKRLSSPFWIDLMSKSGLYTSFDESKNFMKIKKSADSIGFGLLFSEGLVNHGLDKDALSQVNQALADHVQGKVDLVRRAFHLCDVSTQSEHLTQEDVLKIAEGVAVSAILDSIEIELVSEGIYELRKRLLEIPPIVHKLSKRTGEVLGVKERTDRLLKILSLKAEEAEKIIQKQRHDKSCLLEEIIIALISIEVAIGLLNWSR